MIRILRVADWSKIQDDPNTVLTEGISVYRDSKIDLNPLESNMTNRPV